MLKVSPFSDVLAAFRRGEMVIMADDADRENEGDLVAASEKLTAKQISFMMNEARGLICISLSVERAKKIKLPLQVLNNNSPYGTPFTVSVDLKSVGGEGISAEARTETMRALISDSAKAEDFISPGHVFPLIANPSGVLGRKGQTEGSFDLARIAGFEPSGVICEIMNPDGSMARAEDLNRFAERHGLLITTVQEVINYRLASDTLVRETARSEMDTAFGRWEVRVFADDVEQKEHLALIYGNPDKDKAVQVRLHSECLTGDVFGSKRCDCGEQLEKAMRNIVAEGAGVILYLRQEGRGIGLGNKLKAYALQDEGLDTVEANRALGFRADERDFSIAGKMLRALGLNRIRLLTNNPEKISALKDMGIIIEERLPVVAEATAYSKSYLDAKREKMGHLL